MKKKILFSTVIFLCMLLQARGQGNEYIPVAVVVPKQVDNLDESQIMQMGNITLDLATRSGMAAGSQGSPVVLLPVFVIDREDVVEGGMKNIVAVSASVTFIIKNLETDIVYASLSRQIRGSGAGRQRAINDAISKIRVSGDDFSKFVNTGRSKIADYYSNNCSAILMQAETFAKTQQYEAAIAIVASIPAVAPCYPQAFQTLEKLYPDYRKQQCSELYQKAYALYGARQYIDAMAVLYDLDVFDTDCSKDVKALIQNVESKLSAKEKREWDFIVEKDRNRTALAEKRLETVQSIAVAYFGRKTSNMYNLIVR